MINKINSIKQVFNFYPKKQDKKENTQQSSLQYVSAPLQSLQAYNSISFTGSNYDSSESIGEIKNLYGAIKQTSNSETVSIEDAISLLQPLKLGNKKMMDYLLGVSFDNGQKELTINKKAVLYALLLNSDYDIPSAKIPQAIATMLDNENMVFDEKKIDRIFAGNRFKKFSANLKPLRERTGQTEFGSRRAVAMLHKATIQKALEQQNSPNSRANLSFNSNDIFTPLKETKEAMIGKLIEANEEDKLDDDLLKKLIKGINDGNLDIKRIYNDHYSLLNECTTLEEAHELYPELTIPFDTIENNKGHQDPRSIKARILKEDIDKIGLDILRKIYLDFEPASEIIVEFENSHPTTYLSMQNARYSFGSIPEEVVFARNIGLNTLSKFVDFDKVSDKELETLIKHNASKKSRIWAEYIGITNKYWTKTRAIMHKQKHPDTTYYKTDELIDGYLFNLYKKGIETTEANPLSKYADGKKFNAEKKNILESIYYMHRNNFNREIKSPEFLEFIENFDIEGMKESLTKLEQHYKNTFFKWFLTPERKAKYQEAINAAQDMVLEKLEFCDCAKNIDNVAKIADKNVTDEELVEYVFEEDIDQLQVEAERKFDKISQLVKSSNNKELKEFFKNYIGDDKNPNNDYYQILASNLEDDLSSDKISNPYKLVALLKLHTNYIDYVIKNDKFDLDEAEYTQNILSQFTDETGKISYYQLNEYINAKENFESAKNSLNSEEFKNFVNIIEKKFIKNNDFETGLQLLNLYINMSDIFKTDLFELAQNCDKVKNEIFAENLNMFSDKVKFWNVDNDEIIAFDEDKIPQQVVITSNAKKSILADSKGDLERFDMLINKFYNAATKRISDRGGQGIKILKNKKQYKAELKIQGSLAVGDKRIYGRVPTPEDIEKYGNVKYVFDDYGDHSSI